MTNLEKLRLEKNPLSDKIILPLSGLHHLEALNLNETNVTQLGIEKLKQIEISAGSLGHGLPIAVGMCLSKKIKNENGKVFCLVGDGECNEGTTWESLLLANNLNLNNLV